MIGMNTKRATALIISTAMLIGLAPSIPGNVHDYVLADGQTAEIDVRVYATKDQLMNGFIPISSVPITSADKIGKLKFGKKDTGDIEEWYIFGKDKGVGEDNNIAVFATENMTETIFQNYDGTDSTKPQYKLDAGITYSKTAPKENTMMDWSHYGLSLLRNQLIDMASNQKYFDAIEQSMLQPTKTATKDDYGYYTTLDKLYLPDTLEGAYSLDGNTHEDSAAEGIHSEYVVHLYVGSSEDNAGSKKFITTQYRGGSSSGRYWLRSRYDDYHMILGGYTVEAQTYKVNNTYGVRPASNLDLTNVLFASAALAATSSQAEYGKQISIDEAMALRLDGKEKQIGIVIPDRDGITVKRGTTTSDVSLVIQGNDGTNNWYYSKLITGTETVSVDTILETLKNNGVSSITASSIDPTSDNCKIWLEIPVQDADGTVSNTLSYAIDKETAHVHEYPAMTTPSVLMGSDAGGHWWQCIYGENCQAIEDTIINTSGEAGKKDEHHWIDTSEKFVDFIKDNADYLETNPQFLVNRRQSVERRANTETGLCEKVSVYFVFCQDCGYMDYPNTFENVEEAKGHTWLICGVPEGHYRSCTECQRTESLEKHVYENDDAPNCSVCGYLRGHEHLPLKYKDEVKPTCTNDGNIGYYHCEQCHLMSKDSIGTVLLAKAETILKATGHNYDGDKCINCGQSKSSSDGSTDNGGSTGGDGSTRNSDNYLNNSSSGSSRSYNTASIYVSGGNAVHASDGTTPSTALSSNDGTWEQDKSGWKYKYSTGKYATGTASTDSAGKLTETILWVKIGDATFAFGADGYARTGWIYNAADGKWYRCDAEKGVLKGWYQSTEDGYWYYLDTVTGEILTGWQTINGKQYYFAPIPAQDTYVYDEASAKWVYNSELNIHPYGSLYTDTTTPDNRKVDADGAAI